MQNVDWTGVGDLEIFLFHYLGFEDRIQLLGSLDIKVQFQFKNTFFSIFLHIFKSCYLYLILRAVSCGTCPKTIRVVL